MELWSELFSDPVGIASALVIAFTLIMGAFIIWYFVSSVMRDKNTKDE